MRKVKKYFKQKHLTAEMIALYAEKLAASDTGQVSEEVLNHVENCYECKEAVMDVYSMITTAPDMSTLSDEIIEVPKPTSHTEHRWKTMFYYMGVVFVFLALFWIKQYESNDKTKFMPDSTLEYFIKSSYRSGIGELNVITPNICEEIETKTIRFQWDYDQSDPLTITVVNNEQKVMASRDCDSDGITLDNTFPDGLYYWKLETDKDLIYIGKFIVEKR